MKYLKRKSLGCDKGKQYKKNRKATINSRKNKATQKSHGLKKQYTKIGCNFFKVMQNKRRESRCLYLRKKDSFSLIGL